MGYAVLQKKIGSGINQGEGTGNRKWKELINILKVELMRTGD